MVKSWYQWFWSYRSLCTPHCCEESGSRSCCSKRPIPASTPMLICSNTIPLHGTFDEDVRVDGDVMIVGDHRIKFTRFTEPKEIPWGELGVDVVLETTGKFKNREQVHRIWITGPKGPYRGSG